ncbi:MAG: undecaprenyl-phosphate glucose phosphotransferase, partial [Spirochaetia bacterium]|nr:undecaprenyl-phosphate glucose phosphotransferase [Spirochaetia bacterium]
LLAFNYAGLYRFGYGKSRFDELVAISAAGSAAIIIIMSMTFMWRQVSYSRVVLVYVWVLCLLLLSVWRIVYSSIFASLSRREIIIQRLIIIGATQMSKTLIERIHRYPGSGYKIVGVIDTYLKKGREFEGYPVLGGIRELSAVLEKYRADAAFVGIPDYNRKEIADVILKNEKVKFMIASDVLGIITKSMEYGDLYGIPVFELKELPLNNMFNRMVKRTFDILFSGLVIIALSPLFLAIALAIKLTSKGPVLYRQERIGRGNKPFIIYKFRSMRIDAEAKTGPVWAKENDPRRTPFGAFLRKTSLDELPQFFNVLTGSMSVVGPRPERPHFVEKFKDEIPRYLERHKVKSGLAGWAQVNGLRGDTSLEERVKYDLYYIENWSFWFDIKIIVKLALEIFQHNTAY